MSPSRPRRTAGASMQPLEPRLLLAIFEPDIVENGVTGVQSLYDVGERITARAHFHNAGNIGTGQFTVRFYLAEAGNNRLLFIEDGVVANLSPLVAWSEDINIPGWAIPHENSAITPGSYRIAAHLDWGNLVAETSETNNVAYSPYFTIRHPDLEVESVAPIEMQYAPGSFLQTTANVLNTGPARAWASVANPYRIAFYLGADQSTPPAISKMTLLQTGLIQGNLDTGERTTDNLNHLIPLGQNPGRYRIWVKVDSDNELVEVNEGNNWRSSAAFTIVGPDLAPLPITGAQPFYELASTQFIRADVTVQNIGATEAAGTRLDWYLGPADTSQPPGAAERTLLQNALIRPILVGGEASDHLEFPVAGLNTGHHRIWARVDPDGSVNEQDESNNWSYSEPFRIIHLQNLRWENENGSQVTGDVDEGSQVYISFEAFGYDPDHYIPVEIWEDDAADDELERSDLRVRYDPSAGRWRAPWWPAWSAERPGSDTCGPTDESPRDFYFHIPGEHFGFTFGDSSGNLGVNRREDDFGFLISEHTVGAGVPLVLVHGNNSDHAGMLYRWQWLENYIRSFPADLAEFDVYVWKHDTCRPIGFNSAAGSQAASLADYIYDDLQVGVPGAQYADQRVALLAHSQGGLVSRAFMNHADQGDDVSGLITLGTPHHGSPFAVPDWVAAVWKATGGNQATFNLVHNSGLQVGRRGTTNLAWDNLDGAVDADGHTTRFGLNLGDRYDLTRGDLNVPGVTSGDSTPDYYPEALKTDFGTLKTLNESEAFYHKLTAIGVYDPDLSDNTSYAEFYADLATGFFSPDFSSEHKQLSATIRLLGDMSREDTGNANASPYYANDGLVPLQSALFLDISPNGTQPAPFSSLDGDAVTVDESLIAARAHRDMRIHIATDVMGDGDFRVEDHQDILDSTSAQYWQMLVAELRMLLEDVAPTASIHRPGDGEPIGRDVLNRRGYFDLTYHDEGGSGLDPRSILDPEPEFSLIGDAASAVALTNVERRDGNIYRYFFDGRFQLGQVELLFAEDAFADDAGNGHSGSTHSLFVVIDGDANQDGRIDFDDYFRIDSAYLEQPANPTYAQGDFNYDGTINFDDYFLIDSAFLEQGQPSGFAAATTLATKVATLPAPAEPEPTRDRKRSVRSLFSDQPVSVLDAVRPTTLARRC